jgi:hypothetical protein
MINTAIASAENCKDKDTIVVSTIDIKNAVLGFINIDKIIAKAGNGIINTDISSGNITAQEVTRTESNATIEIYSRFRYCFSKY